jgi:hypothetical protein
VQIAHPHAGLGEVVGEFFGHLLGQRGHQDALVALGPRADLFEQVVDLPLGRLDDDLRVDEAGRADDLLDHAVCDAHLVLAGCGREIDGLADAVFELVPLQRAVVECARKAETVLDERALARGVALVHRADLRHRDVGLVDDDEEVVGEEVEQTVRCYARCPRVDVPRVVLDAGAEADLLHHLEVEGRAHAQSLSLE